MFSFIRRRRNRKENLERLYSEATREKEELFEEKMSLIHDEVALYQLDKEGEEYKRKSVEVEIRAKMLKSRMEDVNQRLFAWVEAN